MYSISHTVDDTLQGHLKPRGKAVDAKQKSNGMFATTEYRITNLCIRSSRCLILVKHKLSRYLVSQLAKWLK